MTLILSQSHSSFNGSELVNILDLENPTVEELVELFKDLSLNDSLTRADLDYYEIKLRDTSLFSLYRPTTGWVGSSDDHKSDSPASPFFQEPTES